VAAGEMFPNDKSVVPSAIVTDLAAGKAMLVFYYDPTTKVSAEQRKEVDAAMKKYRGSIDLFALDYTAGVGSTVTSTSLSPEVQKIELLSSALKVNTTPYIVLVDGAGRVVYRFAGFVDRTLLSREVLRATE
jgi:thioredoxin-related protein